MKTNHSENNLPGMGDPCCEESGNWIQINKKLSQAARWVLWLLALVIIIVIALGYFLDPSTVRILWLTISSALLIVILPLLAFWNKWIRRCNERSESDQSSS